MQCAGRRVGSLPRQLHHGLLRGEAEDRRGLAVYADFRASAILAIDPCRKRSFPEPERVVAPSACREAPPEQAQHAAAREPPAKAGIAAGEIGRQRGFEPGRLLQFRWAGARRLQPLRHDQQSEARQRVRRSRSRDRDRRGQQCQHDGIHRLGFRATPVRGAMARRSNSGRLAVPRQRSGDRTYRLRTPSWTMSSTRMASLVTNGSPYSQSIRAPYVRAAVLMRSTTWDWGGKTPAASSWSENWER